MTCKQLVNICSLSSACQLTYCKAFTLGSSQIILHVYHVCRLDCVQHSAKASAAVPLVCEGVGLTQIHNDAFVKAFKQGKPCCSQCHAQ